MAIPKKIHYCWFGGNPLSKLAKKCIKSWKKYCPDYEIIEWNESNFNVNMNDYVKKAYAAKKWAFVSDVARLYALIQQGGIYMDTDMELLKPLDELLTTDGFAGFDSVPYVSAGILAAKQGHVIFEEILREYDHVHFYKEDGTLDLTPNPVRITKVCVEHGLVVNNCRQTVSGLTVFPEDWFYPKDWRTHKTHFTENSYAIHHGDASWLTQEEKNAEKKARRRAKIRKVFGDKFYNLVKKFFRK